MTNWDATARFSAHGPIGVRELERLAAQAFSDRSCEPAFAPAAPAKTLGLERAEPRLGLSARVAAAAAVCFAVAAAAVAFGASPLPGSIGEAFAPSAAAAAWRAGLYDAAAASSAGGFPVHALLARAEGAGVAPGEALAHARAALLAFLAPAFAFALAPRAGALGAVVGALVASVFVAFAPLGAWIAGPALVLALRAAAPAPGGRVAIAEALAAGLLTAVVWTVSPLLAVLALAVRLNTGLRRTPDAGASWVGAWEAGLAEAAGFVALVVAYHAAAPLAGLGGAEPRSWAPAAGLLLAATAGAAAALAATDRPVVSGVAAAGAVAFACGLGAEVASAFFLAAAIAVFLAPRRGRRRQDSGVAVLAASCAVGVAAFAAAPVFGAGGAALGFAVSAAPAAGWVATGDVDADAARRSHAYGAADDLVLWEVVAERAAALSDAGRGVAVLAPRSAAAALAGLATPVPPREADIVLVPIFGPQTGPDAPSELKARIGGVLYADFVRSEAGPVYEAWTRRAAPAR